MTNNRQDVAPTSLGGVPATRFRLGFLGAAGTVTGSRYLVDTTSARVLVDCGLFQGYKTLRLRNWAPFPVAPASIDAVVLTHAHLDHCGYLPRLVQDGFRGPVWCSEATRDLCEILLIDSARLLQEDAEHANRVGSSKHRPALPLYSEADVSRCLRLFRTVAMESEFMAAPGIEARLRCQGHILGAAAVTLSHDDVRVTFSGDVGRPDDAIMPAPRPPADCDWIVCESTYGDRAHPKVRLGDELAPVLSRVLGRGGVVVVPSFAVGRAQMLLHAIAALMDAGTVPDVPVYLNSPMAAAVTALYRRHADDHRLPAAALDLMDRRIRIVTTAEQSAALNRRDGPMVIVSASGMATGGRVLHHLAAFGRSARNAIVLCGYQAGGTRGATLAAGGRTLRIFGRDAAIDAEVVQLAAASAHADSDELLAWLMSVPHPPRGVFLTHGEPAAADALRRRIRHELHWAAHVPEDRQSADLRRQGLDAPGCLLPFVDLRQGVPSVPQVQ